MRKAIRVNLTMGLVVASLIAEVLFVGLLGYGLFRVLDLVG